MDLEKNKFKWEIRKSTGLFEYINITGESTLEDLETIKAAVDCTIKSAKVDEQQVPEKKQPKDNVERVEPSNPLKEYAKSYNQAKKAEGELEENLPQMKPKVYKCNRCKSDMWDNSKDKKNPKAPDLRCKDKSCGQCAYIKEDGQPHFWN